MVHIAVIALFAMAIWLPLLCTPRMCRQERATLHKVERRDPAGILSFEECDRNIVQWVEQIQLWYRDSFAFRSKLLELYNVAHYLVHNYPDKIYGAEGHLILRKPIHGALRSLSRNKKNRMAINLEVLRQICVETETPCLFILIPSKVVVHPEFAPRWLRVRSRVQGRRDLLALIRTNRFPILDLSPVLRTKAKETGGVFFHKYDHHWSTEGACAAYCEMMLLIKQFIPEARQLTAEDYSVEMDDYDTRFSRHWYLDAFFGEPMMDIDRINLPPLRIVKDGKESQGTLCPVYRGGRTDVFCSNVGTKTVVFLRDSFLTLPSQLLNHSFAHTVYLNNTVEGRDPREVIETISPDLLVFALHENQLIQYLARMGE